MDSFNSSVMFQFSEMLTAFSFGCKMVAGYPKIA